MATRVAINGFGRIGRQSLKAMLERYPNDLEVVAINDVADLEANAHLFRYDSTYGRFGGTVEVGDKELIIDGKHIRVFSDRDPGKIPWGEVEAEIIIESTGLFTDATKAAAHRHDSVKKVIISAPAKGEDITLVLGVNEEKYDPAKHNIISNASCTTNCLAPAAKVVNDAFGIERGMMTTVHSFTNDQRTLDVVHPDLRRARTASANIIPTTTGAARALALVIPELKGRFDGFSLRVPTVTVSVVDFVAELKKGTKVEEVNATFKAQADGKLKDILGYTEEPLVSSDFRGDPRSSIIDGLSTMMVGDTFLKVIAWYDNEWGYSSRVADLTRFIGERL
ncbi:MAG TPA: type I glyceraldehyde-3-phosphate dehydrogenase [Ktedonobacterales bacterium]